MNVPMGKETQNIQLEEVFVKYKPIVTFRVKKSLGAHNPDCDDVANEAITDIIEKIRKGEFRGESSVGTFIYTITSRRIVDYIRKKTKFLKRVPEPTYYPDLQEQIEDKERAEMIATAIKKLGPKYREVLQLYYDRELSRKEMAQKLGVSPQKVSERLNYSKRLLKKLTET